MIQGTTFFFDMPTLWGKKQALHWLEDTEMWKSPFLIKKTNNLFIFVV